MKDTSRLSRLEKQSGPKRPDGHGCMMMALARERPWGGWMVRKMVKADHACRRDSIHGGKLVFVQKVAATIGRYNGGFLDMLDVCLSYQFLPIIFLISFLLEAMIEKIAGEDNSWVTLLGGMVEAKSSDRHFDHVGSQARFRDDFVVNLRQPPTHQCISSPRGKGRMTEWVVEMHREGVEPGF
ncbi:hypothetical protein BDK51DRAFT_31198 [Blyttiomyces helicus]|uniref:Uncharacterized protein n=1 Tax=Blyttiomyces helicus TaxID=388810 RepID=A0A4P9WJZ2_9FUNG|nr:hypothetical protein BDK51DRAFT_31198 [Blyttiomyces helicus]|eukprot:RKO93279.1 hypothetical protein BDK51DRAFT_31198 [Blyttiomyces helicus]